MNVDGVFTKLTASHASSRPTKSNPKIEIKLGRLKRVARVGAEASAAKVQGDFTASGRKVLRSIKIVARVAEIPHVANRRNSQPQALKRPTRSGGTIPHEPKWLILEADGSSELKIRFRLRGVWVRIPTFGT